MKKNDKAMAALLAVFPNYEAFATFAGERSNLRSVESFIDYAAKNDIIEGHQKKGLETFLRTHAKSAHECSPPQGLNFEVLLEKKKELLNLNISVRAMTNRINALIEAHRIELPKVSNSMLTRLKKEPADTVYKQNVLRSLAFWLGHERSGSGPAWNFVGLAKLCNTSKLQEHYREGVRIGFALYGRGDVIDHEIMDWLRKTLKQNIEKAGHFLYYRWGRVRSHDITTLYVDFPKEDEAGEPAAYRACIRSAVSIAHQIAIRWALSKYFTKNRFLSIGIVAGDFATLDNYLLPILNTRLPGDPVIRVAGFVRQCLLTNDIRTILCRRPYETALFDGEALNIWWIEAFWSTLYFDFIPELLNDPILKNDPPALDALTRLLYFPEKSSARAAKSEPNAVTTFFRYPHNALLGIEIAKTLYYRRLFREALEVLRIALSIDPIDLTARSLRMVLFRNLAIDAPTYDISRGMLQQAEQEALFIEENCPVHTEDYFCEYAVVHLVKAMQALKFARLGRGSCDGTHDVEWTKRVVFADLDKAAALFGKGITVSPSCIRSFYLYNSVKVLSAVLENDEDLFSDPAKSLNGNPDDIIKPSMDLQWQIGFSRDDFAPERWYEFLIHNMIQKSQIHDDSIDLDAYRPTTYFCHAVSLWDFVPVRTVFTAKRALQMLRDARTIAEAMDKEDICIYSFTRTHGEMMPAKEFIKHMDRSIQMIQEKSVSDLYDRGDKEIINIKERRTTLLMTLNFGF
ncbi:MAG: hypothetical protein C4519_12540 [Desulfobacteraceae bacterium]|nr:MAG: hypothetical protein C4519_12540 [Desulfobacteraceae bacterium]